MPLYEYECDACGKRFEKIRKYSDPPIDVCDKCGQGPVRKLISSPAIQFKGSGFYITDYAKKSSPESSGKSTSGDSGSSEAKKTDEAKKTETTPASTTSDTTKKD